MARDNTVALSEKEKRQLDEARLIVFGVEEVPYGAVISELCDNVS